MVYKTQVLLKFRVMKKIWLIAALGLIGSFQLQAQGKYGKTPQDSIRCIEGLSLYKDFIKSNPAQARNYWIIPFSLCPASSEKMYLDGVDIYEALIKNEKDKAKKEAYIDTILLIHDRRIENFGKEEMILGYKGADLYKYRPEKVEEAYEMLKKSVSGMGNKSLIATIQYFMMASIDMEKKGKISPSEVVENFNTTASIAEWNIQNNQKYSQYYKTALENIEKLAAPYLNCETLVGIVEKNFEANQNNIEWLKKWASMMDSKGCTESNSYIKLAESLYKLEPSAEAAKNMAMVYFGKKDYSQALSYIDKAIEQESDPATKADYYIKQAVIYLKMGNYPAVRTAAQKALGLNASLGQAYLLIGDAYAASASSCGDDPCARGMVYIAAVEKYQKAKAVDASVSSEAQSRINSYSAYFPKKEDCFFQGLKDGDSYTVGCWINETVTVRTK
ncbi:MAG: hypothetical protein KatS3mg034_1937 [Vicingaceae bacterium]|nr:MAG: hypothetical protein KatS3mg034_1937 [Vicingaceae bacterium]